MSESESDAPSAPSSNPATQTNPVFAYKAEFRARSKLLQKLLTLGGLLLLLASLICVIVLAEYRLYAGIGCGAGLLSFSTGFWWGMHWRIQLRKDFQATYATFDRGNPPQ